MQVEGLLVGNTRLHATHSGFVCLCEYSLSLVIPCVRGSGKRLGLSWILLQRVFWKRKSIGDYLSELFIEYKSYRRYCHEAASSQVDALHLLKVL